MTFPTSEHAAIFDLINARANQLSAQIEQVRSTVVAEGDQLRSDIAQLKTDVAMEIQQVADALAQVLAGQASAADLRAAADEAHTQLQAMHESLVADNPAPPPPTP
jgi:gas vesicle protein